MDEIQKIELGIKEAQLEVSKLNLLLGYLQFFEQQGTEGNLRIKLKEEIFKMAEKKIPPAPTKTPQLEVK